MREIKVISCVDTMISAEAEKLNVWARRHEKNIVSCSAAVDDGYVAIAVIVEDIGE